MDKIVQKINSAKNIILSTHRQCDGDGLGAELGLFHALKRSGKNVQIINIDDTPKKYRYLKPNEFIQNFEMNQSLPQEIDLALIFDTNDERLVEPLFSALKKKTNNIVFVDHHPLLKIGPKPSTDSFIDTTAASTGELAWRLIKKLNLPVDREVARSIYTSITFDTQLYRFIRNSPNSHLIAAELLTYEINPEEIHRHLFGHQTVHKIAFLAKALGQIEYFCEGKLAVLKLKDSDMFHYNLEPDESRDVIDMIMNIETLEAAALFREDAPNKYKLSLRSKGLVELLDVAEHVGGGGHRYAAGAHITGKYETLRDTIVNDISKKLRNESA